MEFLERIGEGYLTRKANALPELVEGAAKKRLFGSTEWYHAPPAAEEQHHSPSSDADKDAEIERLRRELANARASPNETSEAPGPPEAPEAPYPPGTLMAPSAHEEPETCSDHEAREPSCSPEAPEPPSAHAVKHEVAASDRNALGDAREVSDEEISDEEELAKPHIIEVAPRLANSDTAGPGRKQSGRRQERRQSTGIGRDAHGRLVRVASKPKDRASPAESGPQRPRAPATAPIPPDAGTHQLPKRASYASPTTKAASIRPSVASPEMKSAERRSSKASAVSETLSDSLFDKHSAERRSSKASTVSPVTRSDPTDKSMSEKYASGVSRALKTPPGPYYQQNAEYYSSKAPTAQRAPSDASKAEYPAQQRSSPASTRSKAPSIVPGATYKPERRSSKASSVAKAHSIASTEMENNERHSSRASAISTATGKKSTRSRLTEKNLRELTEQNPSKALTVFKALASPPADKQLVKKTSSRPSSGSIATQRTTQRRLAEREYWTVEVIEEDSD